MEKENVAKTTKDRIKELLENQSKERLNLETKRSEAEKESAEADIEMTKAVESADLESFRTAKEKKEQAELIINLLTKRQAIVNSNKLVPESESDQVIDALLDYEERLSKDFITDISKHVNELNTLLINYRNDIKETEATIQTWTAKIHPNYRRFSYMKERAESAVPVRSVGYNGNVESSAVQMFLDNRAINPLIKK